MKNTPQFSRSLTMPALWVVLAVAAVATLQGQAPAAQQAAPRPLNRPPALTLVSVCGPPVIPGQSCAITVSASDPDANLSTVEWGWSDGYPKESRAIAPGGSTVTFSRSFGTPQVIRWLARAVDAAGAASAELSGSLNVVAPPAPATPQPSPPTPAPAPTLAASATDIQQLAPLVVMIRGTLPNGSTIGAGVIFAIASDALYIATANHVVRGERPLGSEAPVAQALQVQLRWLRGEWQAARVVDDSFDESLDLAVIRVPNASQLAVPKLPWASFVRPDTLAIGEQVVPIGYPGGNAWFVPQRRHAISDVKPQVIKTEGELVPGYSGGALLTEDWGIVGITLRVGSLQNDLLPIDVALRQIREWGHEVDATFKERPKPSPSGANSPDDLERNRREAESFVGEWIGATMSRDVPKLIGMAATPFYFDQEIVVRSEDLGARLRQTGPRTADNLNSLKIQSIHATTVGELRAKGEEAKRDRVLGSLSMADSDWQVVVMVASQGRTEGAVFFVRNVGGVPKMVGLWD